MSYVTVKSAVVLAFDLFGGGQVDLGIHAVAALGKLLAEAPGLG